MKLLERLRRVAGANAKRKGRAAPPSDIGLVVYRRADGDGWDVREIQQSYDKTVAEIRSEIGSDVEVRRIFGARHPDALGDHELRWMRDREAECWRAPGELITQPRTPSTCVQDVSVTFKPPDAGWIVFGIAAGDQTAEIWASEVFDPFRYLVAVLETLSTGVGGRVTIDTEGTYYDLHCYALGPGDKVRMIVTREPSHEPGSEWERLMDVTTDRASFVRSVYSSMVRYFTSDAYLRNKRQWSSDDPEIGFHAEDFSAFRSGVLDKLLGFDRRAEQ